MKELKDVPYSQKEAEAAAGLGTYVDNTGKMDVPQYELRNSSQTMEA